MWKMQALGLARRCCWLHRRSILANRVHRPVLACAVRPLHHHILLPHQGATRASVPKSTLIVQDGVIKCFPVGYESDFEYLRSIPGMVYFDRTRYISALAEPENAITAFFRPRRFGKSLTISMLEKFHDVKYKQDYGLFFSDLDIGKQVTAGKIHPGQYLVLGFNFSVATRGPELEDARKGLGRLIARSIANFYQSNVELFSMPTDALSSDDPIETLARCLDFVKGILHQVASKGDKMHPLADVKGVYVLADEYDAFANEHLDPDGGSVWEGSAAATLLKDFWTTIKGYTSTKFGVRKCFITGISPLCLTDMSSEFNIVRDVSFEKDFSGLCGLTREDIVAALEMICGSREDVARHLERLTKQANGYHFCGTGNVGLLYNTNTCMGELQAIVKGRHFNLENPANSEVAEPFLRMCARSAAAIKDIQAALPRTVDGSYGSIEYRGQISNFRTSDLRADDESAWRSLMLYFGGLTFDPAAPTRLLKIPNLIAAKRFGRAILQRFNMLDTIIDAVKLLGKDGDIKMVLVRYQKQMIMCDVGPSDFRKSERVHRDLVYSTILANPALEAYAEYQVAKDSTSGRIDLVVHSPTQFIITEWKNIDINHLELHGTETAKVDALSGYDIDKVLRLKFNKKEKFRKGTIQEWIEGDVAKQLRSYVQSPDISEKCGERAFHAHLVLVVGSRQVLVWDMDREGRWIGEPMLLNSEWAELWSSERKTVM